MRPAVHAPRSSARPTPTSYSTTTTDGVKIVFDSYCQGTCEAVVIVCHGFFQSGSTPTFRRLSEALAAHLDVVTVDFRGHGRSGGLFTFSAREGADLEAVLGWTSARYPRIALLGFSLGGAVAINTLAHNAGAARSLVAVSTPSSFEAIEFQFWTVDGMLTGLRGLEPGAGCRPGNPRLPKERPVETIAQLANVPILLVHGSRDAIVRATHSRRLFAAAGEPKRLEIIEGGGHAEALFRDNPAQFVGLVGPFLIQTLAH
jgi:pimeloyl-ACP methyl ester carboxylesterase